MYQTERNGQEGTDALEHIVGGDQCSMPSRSQEEERPEGAIETEEQDRPPLDSGECLAQQTQRAYGVFHITYRPNMQYPAWAVPESSCTIACQMDVARAQTRDWSSSAKCLSCVHSREYLSIVFSMLLSLIGHLRRNLKPQ